MPYKLEAFLLSALIRFSILFIQFKKVASIMGKPMTESSPEIAEFQLSKARQIANAVQGISRRTPWESRCLVQALSVQVMLKVRNIPSTVYLGIAKDGSNSLKAHAWLRCGTSILTGGAEMEQFRQIASFGSLITK